MRVWLTSYLATSGKMEITIGVAIGSSIQIAVGVIPALVIVAWIIHQPLTLFFESESLLDRARFDTMMLILVLVQTSRR